MFGKLHHRAFVDVTRVKDSFKVLRKRDYLHGMFSKEGSIFNLEAGLLHHFV